MGEFITYAQNFEDVMLWRALRSVGTGFYIDIGTADPDEDSVTRAFYDRGWHGVNIEPSPGHFAAVAAARPRDINLCCVIGAAPGEMNLYNIPDTGLSTVVQEIADRHAADGRQIATVTVPVRTLADICREFAPPDIHFLKIDVEGAEKDVLLGADFATYRPWIVVAEATEPMSQVENWQPWDPLLTQADYQFVWFDGLNRFYLAAERAEELRHAFRTPPNVFDGWIRPRGPQQMSILNHARAVQDAMANLREETARTRSAFDAEAAMARSETHASRTEASTARAEAGAARAEAAELRVALATARQEASAARAETARLHDALAATQHEASTAQAALTSAQHEADAARAEVSRLGTIERAREEAETKVTALLASNSWKITAPLRNVSRLFGAGSMRRQRLKLVAEMGQGPSGTKGLARIAVYGLGRATARMSGGRTAARIVASTLPGPYRWLHTHYVAYRNIAAPSAVMTDGPMASSEVPPAGPQTDMPQIRNDVSAEEQAMLLRLDVNSRKRTS